MSSERKLVTKSLTLRQRYVGYEQIATNITPHLPSSTEPTVAWYTVYIKGTSNTPEMQQSSCPIWGSLPIQCSYQCIQTPGISVIPTHGMWKRN